MDKLTFLPIVDLPLAGIVMATFIWHFNRWTRQRNIDTTVDIASRLPKARIRVIVFFACVVSLCWFLDLAFWSLFAILLALGLAFAVAFGGELEGGAFGLLAVAFLIREWAFGFPQLILHPQNHSSQTKKESVEFGELVGQIGIATSPLRPSGDADIGGVKYSVVSYDGAMIDLGSSVVVRTIRNGGLCVAPVAEASTVGAPSDARADWQGLIDKRGESPPG